MAVVSDAATVKSGVVTDLKFIAELTGDVTGKLVLAAIEKLDTDATGIRVMADVLEAIAEAYRV